MTPPTAVIEDGDTIVVRKVKGDDQLEITLHEVVSDVTHAMDFDADRLSKDGVEADLQVALADAPHFCGEGFRLVRREWPTDIGPVDLMCRDEADGWIAVEIKRIGDDRRRRAALPLPRAHPPGPGQGRLPRRPRRPARQAPGARAGRVPRALLGRGRPRGAARRARARAHAVRIGEPLRPTRSSTLRHVTPPLSVRISEREPPWSRCSHR